MPTILRSFASFCFFSNPSCLLEFWLRFRTWPSEVLSSCSAAAPQKKCDLQVLYICGWGVQYERYTCLCLTNIKKAGDNIRMRRMSSASGCLFPGHFQCQSASRRRPFIPPSSYQIRRFCRRQTTESHPFATSFSINVCENFGVSATWRGFAMMSMYQATSKSTDICQAMAWEVNSPVFLHSASSW